MNGFRMLGRNCKGDWGKRTRKLKGHRKSREFTEICSRLSKVDKDSEFVAWYGYINRGSGAGKSTFCAP